MLARYERIARDSILQLQPQRHAHLLTDKLNADSITFREKIMFLGFDYDHAEYLAIMNNGSRHRANSTTADRQQASLNSALSILLMNTARSARCVNAVNEPYDSYSISENPARKSFSIGWMPVRFQGSVSQFSCETDILVDPPRGGCRWSSMVRDSRPGTKTTLSRDFQDRRSPRRCSGPKRRTSKCVTAITCCWC